ncbi:MAG TPA: DUF1801 domain-containing protein [Gemmatimonadaceae bacterium]|jgi:hypothetical protein|nr:DUF1801 domain-containing protein [Gemmatimonadaceae bacterium]
MAEPKTKVNDASVAKFIESVKDAETRADCEALVELMEAATKDKAKMWGSAIVGFGVKKVVYAGGREADWMAIGFSPRKGTLALYGLGISNQEALLKKLGKHDHGKGCLYIKQLSDVDLPTLKKLVAASVKGSGKAKS